MNTGRRPVPRKEKKNGRDAWGVAAVLHRKIMCAARRYFARRRRRASSVVAPSASNDTVVGSGTAVTLKPDADDDPPPAMPLAVGICGPWIGRLKSMMP